MTKRWLAGAVIGAAVAFLLVPSASRAAGVSVVAAQHSFVPQVIVTQAGDNVEFANLDMAMHSVTSKAYDAATGRPIFDSGPVGLGTTAAVRGTASLPAGTSYGFFCAIHPEMQGTLTVV